MDEISFSWLRPPNLASMSHCVRFEGNTLFQMLQLRARPYLAFNLCRVSLYKLLHTSPANTMFRVIIPAISASCQLRWELICGSGNIFACPGLNHHCSCLHATDWALYHHLDIMRTLIMFVLEARQWSLLVINLLIVLVFSHKRLKFTSNLSLKIRWKCLHRF